MAERRDLIVEELRAAEAALEAEPPRDIDLAVRAVLDGAAARRTGTFAWGLALASGALAVVAGVALWPGRHAAPPSPLPAVESLAACDLEAALAAGRCTVRVGAARVELDVAGPAVVRPDASGVRVTAGVVRFAVSGVSAGAPVVVAVSGGRITVVGTRFTVTEEGSRGRVELHEGTIDFTALDGATTRLHAGDVLAWPAPEPAPAPAPRRTVERQAPQVAPESDATLLERAAELRARGKLGEAATVLERVVSAATDTRTAEVASYELGTLREALGDVAASCRHWRSHLARFPNGRFDAAVLAAVSRIGCGTE